MSIVADWSVYCHRICMIGGSHRITDSMNWCFRCMHASSSMAQWRWHCFRSKIRTCMPCTTTPLMGMQLLDLAMGCSVSGLMRSFVQQGQLWHIELRIISVRHCALHCSRSHPLYSMLCADLGSFLDLLSLHFGLQCSVELVNFVILLLSFVASINQILHVTLCFFLCLL